MCGDVKPAVFECERFGLEKQWMPAANENLSGMFEEKRWHLSVA